MSSDVEIKRTAPGQFCIQLPDFVETNTYEEITIVPRGRNHKRRQPSFHKRMQSRALMREALPDTATKEIKIMIGTEAHLTLDDYIALEGELQRRRNRAEPVDTCFRGARYL